MRERPSRGWQSSARRARALVESRERRERFRRPQIVPDERQAKRFIVSGQVQGVGYRFFAQRAADRLGVAGYVKNLRDGRVEVYAIGTAEELQSLRAELERGPRAAGVSRVSEEEAAVTRQYANGFGIEHDW